MDILETENDAQMEYETTPVLEVAKNSPLVSETPVSRKRRTEIEIPMEVSEVTCSFGPSKGDYSKKRRTICATTNSPNIKRLNFTINPDTSSFRIKENLEARSPTVISTGIFSPVKKPKEVNQAINKFSAAKLLHKVTKNSPKSINAVSKLNDVKCLDYSLSDADEYLRQLQIRKLEKELGLTNVELTNETTDNDIEMYYRRLQILKLETDLKLQPSKFTEDFVE